VRQMGRQKACVGAERQMGCQKGQCGRQKANGAHTIKEDLMVHRIEETCLKET
jgi:hypothetical protein